MLTSLYENVPHTLITNIRKYGVLVKENGSKHNFFLEFTRFMHYLYYNREKNG